MEEEIITVEDDSEIEITTLEEDILVCNDYEGLTNLPTINGIEVIGEKVGGDYLLANLADLPTKVSELENDEDYLSTETDPVYSADKPFIALKSEIPDVSGKEDTSNKVTSISASSTDTQYPSAKLVYDQLAGKQASGSYEVTSNKENTTLDTSTTKYPTNNLVKTYVDGKVTYNQVKTSLDATLVLGAIYKLGTLGGNISFALPDPATAGLQEIALIFNLDSNLRTLTITGTNFYPATLTLVINLGYVVRIFSDGTKWVIGTRSFVKA